MYRRNMRKEFITEEELMSMLRERGIDDLSQADKVYMEGDGPISVISRRHYRHDAPEKKKENKV